MSKAPDKEYDRELENLRRIVNLAWAGGGGDPDSEEASNAWRWVEQGFRAGWDARERTQPAAPPSSAPTPVAHKQARSARQLKVGEVVYVRPFALIEHRASGAIYLDPLFDVRPEADPDYCIRITVEEDGVIARGPVNLHRETNDRPGKPGLRLVKRFERVD